MGVRKEKDGGGSKQKHGEDLGDKDAGKHGDWVDRTKGEWGRHIAGGQLVKEAKGGRIGHRAGQNAGGLQGGHFKNPDGKHRTRRQGEKRGEKSHPDNRNPGGRFADPVPGFAGRKGDSGKKENDAGVAQHLVGGLGKLPGKGADGGKLGEDEAGEERATSEAQLERGFEKRERLRDL